jgi:hypothetical protein
LYLQSGKEEKNLPKKGGRNGRLSTIHAIGWNALKLLPQNALECGRLKADG